MIWMIGVIKVHYFYFKKNRNILNTRFVLILRRFSTFSDRSLISAILQKIDKRVSKVYIIPYYSKPKDWDPFLIGFAGLKWSNPIRSIPVYLSADNNDWQTAAKELIKQSKKIFIDITDLSLSVQTEIKIINELNCLNKTIFLCDNKFKNNLELESNNNYKLSNVKFYSKSWIRALFRITVGIIKTYFFSLFFLGIGGIFAAIFIIYLGLNIFIRPSVDKDTLIFFRSLKF